MKNLTIILILTGLLCSFGIFRQTLGNNLLSFDDEFTIEQFLQLNYQNFIMENTNGKSLDFQQEQIKKYLIAREYLKELLYHCKNAKSSLPLHQACQSYRTRLENDTYDYSSIFASTGSLQGLLKAIKKGEKLTAITNPPKFLLPLTILSDYRKDNAPLTFQVGEWYLIITPNKTELFIAKKGDTQARIMLSITDNWFFKNSEYGCDLSLDNSIFYLTVKNKHLLLTVVDSCGGGSGEGYESVFQMDKHGRLQHLTCYDYRNRELFQDKRENRYFRGSTQFKQLIPLKQSVCKGKEDIQYYVPPL